jgi:DNA-directed DNA polymerase III PolC
MIEFTEYEQPFPAGVKLPKIKVEKKYYDELKLDTAITNLEFLRAKCEKALGKYLDNHISAYEIYNKRLDYELNVLDELGFIDYILLNWDVLNFCHEKKIPTGFGRGSAAGSLVLFLIKVTRVDPIKYELFFERFVSKSRARKIEFKGETFLDGSLLCDVDNDIAYDRRQEVIDYIEQKFKGYTCKILTLNTLSSKLCIKECCKLVGELPEEDANRISSMIPKKFGKVEKISKALEESAEFLEFSKEHDKIIRIARKLEGLNKNTGVHPSGIAISYYPVSDVMPMQSTNDGHLISGYDMNGVSELMVKFDILGLRTLSVTSRTCDMLGIDMYNIDPSDPFIYTALDNLQNPKGLFQIEADTNFKVCQQINPKSIDQLSAVIALARPGALGFVDLYEQNIRSGEMGGIHEFFSDILSYTGGIPLYQEQLMKMANKVGFSLDESEQLRRIVGKKKVDQMKEWKDKISDKIKENNLDPVIGETLWRVAEDSANYSFNLSHSMSYGILSAITTYLKFKHPQEFFLALLEMALSEPDPLGEISLISKELSEFDIKLLPPDLSKSKIGFSIEGKNIRYGLNAIKGISSKSLENLIEFRGNEFKNPYDVFTTAKDCGLNIGILCALIQAGSLDSMSECRSKTVLHATSFNLLTDRVKRNIIALGEKHKYDVLNSIFTCVKDSLVGDDGRPIFTERTFETFKKKYGRYKEIYDLNKKHEKFANWYFESKILGYSHSFNLRDVFVDTNFTGVRELKASESSDVSHIVGVVDDCVVGKSRANNRYMRINISDETGALVCIMSDNQRKQTLSNFLDNDGKKPQKGSIITVVGRKSSDAFFVDALKVIDEQIYMKLSELK